jgi:hypothetical protein
LPSFWMIRAIDLRRVRMIWSIFISTKSIILIFIGNQGNFSKKMGWWGVLCPSWAGGYPADAKGIQI